MPRCRPYVLTASIATCCSGVNRQRAYGGHDPNPLAPNTGRRGALDQCRGAPVCANQQVQVFFGSFWLVICFDLLLNPLAPVVPEHDEKPSRACFAALPDRSCLHGASPLAVAPAPVTRLCLAGCLATRRSDGLAAEPISQRQPGTGTDRAGSLGAFSGPGTLSAPGWPLALFRPDRGWHRRLHRLLHELLLRGRAAPGLFLPAALCFHGLHVGAGVGQ